MAGSIAALDNAVHYYYHKHQSYKRMAGSIAALDKCSALLTFKGIWKQAPKRRRKGYI
jgi:hypothetical protein